MSYDNSNYNQLERDKPEATKRLYVLTILYFAGAETYLNFLIEEGINNLLFSYYYVENNIQELLKLAEGKNIFMDSGAFTAFKQQIIIDVNQYASWLRDYEDKLTLYANLDVIGDAEATKRNQELLEKEDLHPLPTYHQGEHIDYLIDMCKKYEYIALGGMVGAKEDDLDIFLSDCFRIISNYPNVKVHGFGMTNFNLIKKYKFYSVDSTSWLGWDRWGHVYQFDEEKIEMRIFKNDSKTGEMFNLNLENNKEVTIHNIREWKKASVVLENLWNNTYEQFSEEHRLKLSQSKQGNSNALKHGKYSYVEHLWCNNCKIKLKCELFKEGEPCSWEKDLEGIDLMDMNNLKKFMKGRLNKHTKRLFRVDLKEFIDGGTIQKEGRIIEDHILSLIKKINDLEKGG